MQKSDSFSTMRELCYRIDWLKVGMCLLLLYFLTNSYWGLNNSQPNETSSKEEFIIDDIIKEKDKQIILEGNKTLKKNIANDKTQKASVLGFLDLNVKKKPSLRRSKFYDQDGKVIKSFLKRFVHVAINEEKKFGVPTSVILASALLQSDVGFRSISKKSNNYFGVQCSDGWKGKKTKDNGCYRAYENAWSSFRDHSIYVTKELKLGKLKGKNYKVWAEALADSGKFDTKNFEKNLVKVIEDLELHRLDN